MAIREHLPSAREIASWPAVKVMQLGHEAVDAAHRIRESHEIAQLDFSGKHALRPGDDQRTVYEIGAPIPLFPTHHAPKHEQTSNKDLSINELRRIKLTAPYHSPDLYNHKELIDTQLELEDKQK